MPFLIFLFFFKKEEINVADHSEVGENVAVEIKF
jgi:hypothetical protein